MFYGINAPDERLLFADDFKKAAGALNSSTLVVYPVDAHGLTTTRPDFANLATMKTLAEHTGGRAFYNTNDLRKAIREAIDESGTTYELGFYPTTEKWDSRFHRIKVTVKGKNLRVRTRDGYLALAEPTITPEARGALVSYAVTTLLEDTRLGVTVRVAGNRGGCAERANPERLCKNGPARAEPQAARRRFRRNGEPALRSTRPGK